MCEGFVSTTIFALHFGLDAFTFDGVDLVGLTLGACVFAYPFEMKDAFNVLLLHVLWHLRVILWHLVVEILVWLSPITDIVNIARKSLPSSWITNISINISNCKAIFSISTYAANAGSERDLDHILIDMTWVIVFSFLHYNIIEPLSSHTFLDQRRAVDVHLKLILVLGDIKVR